MIVGQPGWVVGSLAAAVAAGLGVAVARRRPGLVPVVVAVGVAVGWVLACEAAPGSVLRPRSVGEHLAGASLAFVVAAGVGLRVRSRWVGALAAMAAVWWLAGAGVARPEFWRVLLGGWALVWALRWGRAPEPPRAMAVALVLVLAAAVGQAWTWVGVGLVLAVVAGGAWRVKGGLVPAGLLGTALLAALLAAGGLVRGRVGVMDLACLGAVVAGPLVPRVQGRLGRLRGASAVLAPVLVAGVVVAGSWGVAWVVARGAHGVVR